MTDSLQTLLLQGKIKAPYLPVQVVKQIDSNSYIIADKSRAAVLDTSKSSQGKNLVSGASYKIIKGIKGELESKTKKLLWVSHIQSRWRNNFQLSNPTTQGAGTVPASFLLNFCVRVVYSNYPTFVLIILTCVLLLQVLYSNYSTQRDFESG